jgi:hypothetical protein
VIVELAIQLGRRDRRHGLAGARTRSGPRDEECTGDEPDEQRRGEERGMIDRPCSPA